MAADPQLSLCSATNASMCTSSHAWPAVLLLGAQKSGTTSLFRLIVDHAQVCHPVLVSPAFIPEFPTVDSKEVHYFDDDERYELGARWYRQHFRCDRAIDATPILHDELAAARLSLSFPAAALALVRAVVILREPISRDLSFYNHLHSLRRLLVARRPERLNHQLLREAGPGAGLLSNYSSWVHNRVALEAGGVATSLRMGSYAPQFVRYAQVIPEVRTFILNRDQLIEADRFGPTFKALLRFLGVSSTVDGQSSLPRSLYHLNQLPPTESELPKDACIALRSFYSVPNSRLAALLSTRLSTRSAPPMQPAVLPFRPVSCEGSAHPETDSGASSTTAAKAMSAVLQRVTESMSSSPGLPSRPVHVYYITMGAGSRRERELLGSLLEQGVIQSVERETTRVLGFKLRTDLTRGMSTEALRALHQSASCMHRIQTTNGCSSREPWCCLDASTYGANGPCHHVDAYHWGSSKWVEEMERCSYQYCLSSGGSALAYANALRTIAQDDATGRRSPGCALHCRNHRRECVPRATFEGPPAIYHLLATCYTCYAPNYCLQVRPTAGR